MELQQARKAGSTTRDPRRLRSGGGGGGARSLSVGGAPRLVALQARANRGPHAQGLVQLQARMDASAAPFPVRQKSAVVQRMSIGGEHIFPTGKNGKALMEKVRLAMFSAGLSPHGSGKKFKQVADGTDHDFKDDGEFLGYFLKLAETEVQRVQEARARKEKVRGWTRPLKMGRPAWPEAYRNAVQKGEDIRHIVRNATLKNAIEAEREYQASIGEPRALDIMTKIAQTMGIQEGFTHSTEATMAIYRNAYLNLGNLFPGPGAINRVIGLTADGITKIGLGLMQSADFAEPGKISEVFDEVALMVATVGDQMDRQAEKMDPKTAKVFLGGFEDFFDNIEDYLIDREHELVKAASAVSGDVGGVGDVGAASSSDAMMDDVPEFAGVTEAEIGRELVDIGANFGFDIPPESLGNDTMAALVKSEIDLASYKPGNPEALAGTLSQFVKIKSIMGI